MPTVNTQTHLCSNKADVESKAGALGPGHLLLDMETGHIFISFEHGVTNLFDAMVAHVKAALGLGDPQPVIPAPEQPIQPGVEGSTAPVETSAAPDAPAAPLAGPDETTPPTAADNAPPPTSAPVPPPAAVPTAGANPGDTPAGAAAS